RLLRARRPRAGGAVVRLQQPPARHLRADRTGARLLLQLRPPHGVPRLRRLDRHPLLVQLTPMPGPRIAVWVGAIVARGAVIVAVTLLRGGNGPAGATGPSRSDAAPAAAPSVDAAIASGPSGAPPAGSERELAARLLESGHAEAAAGRYIHAEKLFQEAYARDLQPSTLLEVGRMEHLTGRCREAQRTTMGVLAAAPAGAVADAAK